MNSIIGTIMIFGAVLFAFFGLPIIGLFIFSLVQPAKIQPQTIVKGQEIQTQPGEMPMPITVKKVLHKGRIVWVDA